MTDGIKSIKDEISREEARLTELDEERDRLSRHIAGLKDRLSSIEKTSSVLPAQQTILPSTHTPSTSAEKVALFMDLFRGRADVYPKRWVNTKKNSKGYSPACSNEWAHLASVRRMKPTEVEALANEAVRKGQVIGVRMGEPADDPDEATPWTRPPSRRKPKPVITGPLPGRVGAVLSQLLFVEVEGLPSALINQIKRLAAFQNPEFYKKQAMRLPTALTPRVISCAEDHQRHVALPRGCADDLEVLLSDLGVDLSIEDKRTDGDLLGVEFHGELTATQENVVQAMVEHEIGVFVAPPGSGKTVVGANLIARRKRSTLVLVHRTQLLEQWIAQLSLFLNLKPKEIGQIGGGKRKPNGNLDVAMIQSLVRKDEVKDIVATYGHVIVDECHHVPAVSFERIMREVRARFVVGLTATPRCRDGHHPILHLQMGPARFTIDAKKQAATRAFDHKLIVRETDFRLPGDAADFGIQDIYRQLSQDERRNRLILDDVVQALEEKRSPILLTERRDHAEPEHIEDNYTVEYDQAVLHNLEDQDLS